MKTKRILSDHVYLASDFRCVYCEKDILDDFEAFLTVAKDHVVPRSAGGPDGLSNRVVACAACDRLKGSTVVASVDEARKIIRARRARRRRSFETVRQVIRQQSVAMLEFREGGAR